MVAKIEKKLANLNFYSVLVLVHYGRVMEAAAEFISFFLIPVYCPVQYCPRVRWRVRGVV